MEGSSEELLRRLHELMERYEKWQDEINAANLQRDILLAEGTMMSQVAKDIAEELERRGEESDNFGLGGIT